MILRDVIKGKRRVRYLWKPASLLGVSLAAAIFCGVVFAAEWTTYTSMRSVNDVTVYGTDVWGATSGGVLRFSLVDSTYTRYTNLEGLAGNNVLCVEADEEGNLWFGTDGDGLSKFVVESGTFKAPFTEFSGLRINSLYAYEGKLFVGTEDGVSLFLPDKEEVKESYRQLGELPKDVEVLSLAVLEDRIWVGTEQGLAWADLDQPNLKDPKSWGSKPSFRRVRGVIQVGQTVLAATDRAVFRRVSDVSWVPDKIFLESVEAIELDGESAVVAASGRIFRRGDKDWREEGRIWGKVKSLKASQDYGLWVGTKNQGLKNLISGKEKPLPPLEGPSGNRFTDLTLDANRVLWTATAERDLWVNGAYRFDGKEWVNFFTVDGLPSNAVVSVQADPDRGVWLGTWGGGAALLLDNGTPEKADDVVLAIDNTNSILEPTDAPTYVVVNDFSLDGFGNLWMLNFISAQSKLTPVPASGLIVIDGLPYDKGEVFTPSADDLPSSECMAIAIDDAGLKWIGTLSSGFFLLDDGGTPFQKGDDTVVSFSTESHDDLTSNKIADIAVDGSGVVWVATDNGVNAIRGIYSLSSGYEVVDWQVYSTADGLSSNMVNVVIVDSRNNKWLGTEGGLSCISPDGRVAFTFTTSNSGLVDNRVKALAFDEETGELWIGTIGGLSKLQTAVAEGFAPSHVKVYPNPFIIDGSERSLTFSGLPEHATVRVFTLTGELVRTIRPSQATGGETTWDGMNDSGYFVGSGVYFYAVTGEEGRTAAGKLAVVNEL